MDCMIYIAGPLFNEMERRQNAELDAILQENGFSTYLPQRDGGEFAKELAAGTAPEEVRRRMFLLDIEAVKDCEILLFLFDGRVPDEGACFELGMAYSLGKGCLGYKTDARSFIGGYDNLMLTESLEGVFHTPASLVDYLKKRKVDTP